MSIYPEVRFCKRYLKHPDGEDCLTKVAYCGVVGAAIGNYFAVQNYFTIKNPPKGFFPILYRGASITIIPVGCLCTFAATVCISTNLRGKDDHLNYILGGATAGVVYGIARRKYLQGFFVALAGAFFGYVMKDSQINDWFIMGHGKPDYSHIFDKTLYIKKRTETGS